MERTRREFLTGASVLALTYAAAFIPENTLCQQTPDPERKPTIELEGDILTENELAETNISIYQGTQTSLFLKRSALGQFPLFEDAAKRILDQAVIVIVDTEDVCYLPEDARFVFETVHPEIFSVDDLDIRIWESIFKERIEFDEELQTRYLELTAFSTNKTKRKRLEDKNEILRSQISKDKSDYQLLNEFPEETIAKFRKGYFGTIILTNRFLDPRPYDNVEKMNEFSKKYPHLLNRAYVYINIQNSFETSPSFSYPSVSSLEEDRAPRRKTGGYRFRGVSNWVIGWQIRHEISHYRDPNSTKNEYRTDTLAYLSILRAWKKYQKTGDTSGYPFVVITEQGSTVT